MHHRAANLKLQPMTVQKPNWPNSWQRRQPENYKVPNVDNKWNCMILPPTLTNHTILNFWTTVPRRNNPPQSKPYIFRMHTSPFWTTLHIPILKQHCRQLPTPQWKAHREAQSPIPPLTDPDRKAADQTQQPTFTPISLTPKELEGHHLMLIETAHHEEKAAQHRSTTST